MNILEEIQNCPVEWKELGDKNVAKLSRGKVMSKQFLEENKGEYPVYSSQTANNGEIGRISSFEYDGEYITWTTDGANAGTVFYRKGKFSVTNVCGLVEINSDQLLTKFVYYYLTISTKKYVSSGMGNPKLMSNVMGKIKIPIPPLEIQEKIVQILDKFTDYVTELASELVLRQKQYSYFKDYLLNFDEDGSGGANNKVYQVEWKTLGEVAKFNYGYTDKAKDTGDVRFIRITDIDENGYLKSNNKKYIALSEESRNYLVKYGDLLMARTGATYGKTLFIDTDEASAYASFLIKITPSEELNSRYYWHFSKSELYWKQANNLVSKAGQPQFNANSLKNVKIPVPSLEIQSRIVQVLDNFDMVCNDLNIGLPKEIELRQKQYEYFREKLLTFIAEGVYTESRVEEWDNSAIIKLLQWVFGPIRVELGQIFNTKNGYTPTKTNLDNWKNGTIPWFRMEDIRENGGILSDSIQHITEGAVKGELFSANSIIIATSATIGYHALVTRKFLANQRFTCLLAKEGISGLFIPNFLYYYCFKLDEFCRQNTLQGNFATVDMTKFKKFKFIIPSIKRQREIISILDHFNTLTTSISEGLPKEIELRQKQYEYWREQLLNFDL